MKKPLFIAIILIFFSCGSQPSLDFDTGRKEFWDAICCLNRNYSIIFPSSEMRPSIDIYNSQRISNDICESDLRVFEDYSITVITYDKDSTVAFYSNPSGGIKSIQTILMYATNRKKIEARITSDIKLKTVKGNGWYVLEKVISLAN